MASLAPPVTLIEEEGQRWLVAPYGEANWVRNARVAGRVTLSRGGRSQPVSVTQLGPEENAPRAQEVRRARADHPAVLRGRA